MAVRNFTLKMFGHQSRVAAFSSSGYEGIIEHDHDFVEILYITQGHGVHTIRKQQIEVGEGDMLIILPGDAHSLAPKDENSFTWDNCIIDPDFLEQPLPSNISEKVINFSGSTDIAFMMSGLTQEYRTKNLHYQEIMRGYAYAVVNQFLRALELECDKSEQMSELLVDRKEQYIRSAVTYLRQHYSEKIRLQDVAASVGISSGYLERIFREERDTSPIEYLNVYRIEQACKLLLTSSKSIADICQEIGYNDMKFFYVVFKRQTGVSPGVYRRIKKRHPEATFA